MCSPGCVLFTLVLCLNPIKAINIPLLLIIISNLKEWEPLEEYLTSHALEKTGVLADFPASGKIRKSSICCDVMFVNFLLFLIYARGLHYSAKQKDQNLTMIQRTFPIPMLFYLEEKMHPQKKAQVTRPAAMVLKRSIEKVAISTLDKCMNMLRYTKAAALHNSLWHCGCNFVDGGEGRSDCWNKHFHLHSPEKGMKTWSNLAVNIQSM